MFCHCTVSTNTLLQMHSIELLRSITIRSPINILDLEHLFANPRIIFHCKFHSKTCRFYNAVVKSCSFNANLPDSGKKSPHIIHSLMVALDSRIQRCEFSLPFGKYATVSSHFGKYATRKYPGTCIPLLSVFITISESICCMIDKSNLPLVRESRALRIGSKILKIDAGFRELKLKHFFTHFFPQWYRFLHNKQYSRNERMPVIRYLFDGSSKWWNAAIGKLNNWAPALSAGRCGFRVAKIRQ